MPVACFEGPSAAGKTTLVNALEDAGLVEVVPEVNALYVRPSPEPPLWYFDRQAERMFLADKIAAQGKIAALDGDPLQPLWYNWAYHFKGWQPLDVVADFYRQRVRLGALRFPDLYVLLEVAEPRLWERMSGDATRVRERFELHLQYIHPQKRYFQRMNELDPGRVIIMNAEDAPNETRQKAAGLLRSLTTRTTIRDEDLLEGLIAWLGENKA